MQWDYRSIMSGQRRDPMASLARGVLRAAAVPYALAVKRRNRGFDNGRRPIVRCDVPVISVGNLTTGGTGKTPIVCYLAKWYRRRGVRVAIVSRGYGRGNADANDEAMELSDRLPDVPHVQDPDRVEAVRIAVEELESELILVDDGFQHRRLYRDLNIVVVDATCPFGFGYTLPRGLLREPIDGLRRADLVVVTRCDAVDEGRIEKIEATIRGVNPELSVARSHHRPCELREHPDRSLPIETLADKRVAVVSAIGNPSAFEKTVVSCGATVVVAKSLPDHDPYSPETVATLCAWIADLSDSIDEVVCTHKDLVKLQTDRLGGKRLTAVIIDLEIDDDLSKWLEPIAQARG